MDKFKNLFTDEEFEEDEDFDEPVKIKEVKKEEPKKDKLPTFMREKLEKEEKKVEKADIPDFKINQDSVVDDVNIDIDKVKFDSVEKYDNDFKFPIDLEESDFTEISRVSRQARTNMQQDVEKYDPKEEQVKKASQKVHSKKEVKVAELYKDKKDDLKEDIKKFQATPIISPIYGVLDKNYRKDEIETRGGNYEINRPSKTIDFDSVRKKAYGNNKLEEDIKNNLMCENCDYFKNAKTCKKDLDKDDLMYDALCEKEDDITLDEAAENYYDYGVEYEKKVDIDSYEQLDEEEVKIVNHEEEEVSELPKAKKSHGVPPVKSSINLLSTLKKSAGDDEDVETESKGKDLELTDDLFNLIDSMYDEGNEE